jgi:hypothetical protein
VKHAFRNARDFHPLSLPSIRIFSDSVGFAFDSAVEQKMSALIESNLFVPTLSTVSDQRKLYVFEPDFRINYAISIAVFPIQIPISISILIRY